MNEGVKDCGSASNGRYVQGCRCDACRHAHVMAWKVRELRSITGRTYFVDAEPVRQRLLALYSMGYTRREIERFGVSRSTQYALIHAHNRSGKPLGRVKRETAEKLARVRGRRLSPNQRVPADAAALMVRDWHDSGIALAQIAKRCGLDRQIVDSLYHGRSQSVKAATLLALLDHKEELDDTARPEPRRSYAGTLHKKLSDWEVEEAYAEHKAGKTMGALAARYHTYTKALKRAFDKLEEKEAVPCRA